MQIITVIISIVLGALIGSFVNVVIHRIPRSESIITPASHCPKCGAPIKPWQNIPIVSWVWLKGRCAACQTKISAQYPLVELALAAWFGMVAIKDGGAWQIILGWALGSVLLAIAVIDYRHGIIPNKIVLPAAVVFLLLQTLIVQEDVWIFAVYGIGAAAALVLLNIFSLLVFKKEGIFGGDIKLTLCLGFALGLNVIAALFIGFLFGAMIGIVIMRFRKQIHEAGYIPFGPFLSAGAAISYLWGQPLIDWYLRLMVRS